MPKKIAVIFTGGTISMKVDPRLAAAIPAMKSEEIMAMVMNIDKIADIEIINFSQLPSPHLSIDDLTQLRKVVLALIERPDIDGIVITHGTDTLEETAYYLDLSLKSAKPIVLVAAMRNASELGYDGPANLSAAICTAASDNSRNRGVLIVMNNDINSALETTKTHTMALNTFRSIEFGPLGIVDNDQVIYYRNLYKHHHIEIDGLSDGVYLIKTALGMDDTILQHLIDIGAEGFVIEAMGRGNVPPKMVSGIKRAIDKGLPVVIVSRCPTGRVLDSYGYVGGGRQLKDMGAIFASNLNGQKARIKLMLAIAYSQDINEIKRLIERDNYEK